MICPNLWKINSHESDKIMAKKTPPVNKTTNKPHTRWWVELILVLAIIIAGAYPVLYSMSYVVAAQMGLPNWQFIESANYMPQDLVTKLSNENDKETAINNWCDWLIEKDKDYAYRLDNWQEHNANNFVINSAAAKLIINSQTLPDDMIFLFDGTEGWNQVGSKDKVRENYAMDTFMAITGNCNVVKVPVSKIDHLRWTVDDGEKPFYNASNPYINYIAMAAVSIAVVITVVKCRSWMTVISMAAMGALTAIITSGFASWGNQMLYNPKVPELPYSPILMIGAAAGASFAVIASAIKASDKTRLFCKLTILGAITGLVTSCFAHAAIMAYRETTELSGIKGGAGYGIYAGVVIAILAFAVKSDSMNQEQPKPQEQI